MGAMNFQGANVTTIGGGIFDNCKGSSGADDKLKFKNYRSKPYSGWKPTYNSCPQSSCAPEGVTTGITPALVMPAALLEINSRPPDGADL